MRRHWLPSPRYTAARSHSVSPALTSCIFPADAGNLVSAADSAASAGQDTRPGAADDAATTPAVGDPGAAAPKGDGRADAPAAVGTSTIASTAATNPPASDCCTPSPRTRTA